MVYIVLWHLMNGWSLEQATKHWPPTISHLFKSYALWHEKLAVPGFAFVSGFFGKGFIQGPAASPRRWETTVTVLLIGTIQYQVLCEVTGAVFQGLLNGDWQIPTNVINWDHLWTWYLFALLVWRIVTPVVMLFKYPLLVSMFFAFFHIHCPFGWPAEFRARVFHFFPYYVAGLTCDATTLSSIRRPRLLGVLGIGVTFLFTCLAPESFLGHIYFQETWNLGYHLMFWVQYALCGSILLSVILLVTKISIPLFPFSHTSSTLAIYIYHWQFLMVLDGKCPFSSVVCFGQNPSPLEQIMEYFSPVSAIFVLHVLSYVSCVAIGSKQFWKLVQPISNPDYAWLFRNNIPVSEGDLALPLASDQSKKSSH